MKIIPAAPLAAGMIAFGAALATGRGAPTQDFAVAGTARDDAGRPVAGAEVVVLLHRVADAGEPEACSMPGTALGAARGVTDRSGAFRLAVPLVAGDPRPNCLMMQAVVRDTAAPWRGIPPRLAGELVLPLTASPPRANVVLSRPEGQEGGGMDTPDDEAAELATGRVPGYAGLILERCTLVVFSTHPERHGAAARAHVRATQEERAGGARGCPGPQRVEVRRVRYDFAQLSRWYRKVDVLTAMEGWASSDIDEARNRIVFEYTDPVGAARARRTLPALGVPVEAVVIEAPPVRLVMPSDTFGPDTPRVGVRLAPRAWAASPSWSADGREIFFTSADGPREAGATVRAVDVATRQVRQVGRVAAENSGRSATRVSRDGRWVFAALSAPGMGGEALWRFPSAGGAPERVADGLAWPWFAASADGSRFAFQRVAPGAGREGQLVVFDAARRTQVPVPGTKGNFPPGMVELSPDGGRLVYSLAPPVFADSPGVYLFDVASGRSRRVWAGSREVIGGPRALAVRWAGSTPQVLIAEPEGGRTTLSVLDTDAGTRTALGAVETGERMPDAAAWSPDGSRVALWTPVEIGPQSCGGGVCISRNVIHWRLLVWNAATRTATTAAELTADEGASWLAFSPDGRRIGYVLFGQLHVVEVEGPRHPESE